MEQAFDLRVYPLAQKKTHVLSGWRRGKFANGDNELRVACSVTLFEGEGLDEGEFLARAFLRRFPVVQKLLRSGCRRSVHGERRQKMPHLRPRVAASQRGAFVRRATTDVPSSGFAEDSANLIEMIAVMSGHMLCESSHGDSASLGMIAVASPLLGRKALE